MGNLINESGTKLEEDLESFLKSNEFPYKRQKSWAEAIDFIIPTKGNYIPTKGFYISTKGFDIPTKGFYIPTKGIYSK